MRMSVSVGTVLLTLGLLFPAAARAQEGTQQQDARAELEALKKRVAELEARQNAQDDSLRKAVERLSEPTSPTDFQTRWNWHDGLRFETADKAFSLHLGAVIQYDAEWFHTGSGIQKYQAPTMTSALGNQADGDEIRRLRLISDGTIYSNTFYRLEVDFAGRVNSAIQSNVAAGKAATATAVTSGDVVQIDRAYIGTTAFQPFATVTVGHIVEPFNLETVTNSDFITFMERARDVHLRTPVSDGHSAFRTPSLTSGSPGRSASSARSSAPTTAAPATRATKRTTAATTRRRASRACLGTRMRRPAAPSGCCTSGRRPTC